MIFFTRSDLLHDHEFTQNMKTMNTEIQQQVNLELFRNTGFQLPDFDNSGREK